MKVGGFDVWLKSGEAFLKAIQAEGEATEGEKNEKKPPSAHLLTGQKMLVMTFRAKFILTSYRTYTHTHIHTQNITANTNCTDVLK